MAELAKSAKETVFPLAGMVTERVVAVASAGLTMSGVFATPPHSPGQPGASISIISKVSSPSGSSSATANISSPAAMFGACWILPLRLKVKTLLAESHPVLLSSTFRKPMSFLYSSGTDKRNGKSPSGAM